MMKEAMLFRSLPEQKVSCSLCHHRCQIADSKFGICGVRQNKGGTLLTLVYGDVIAAHVDPIEKKPLYHFLPGTTSFSIATIGCNFRCPFCQNWQISQSTRRNKEDESGYRLTPEEVVHQAKSHGCQSVSYTYTEPTIFFEYAFDSAKLAKKQGLANVFVTNGYMTPEALEVIHPYLDACNVDLKSFKEDFYKEFCRAHLEPVLNSIRLMKKLGIWIEVTTLVIPDQNDSDEELTQVARFIHDLDPNIPWHISRFHPDYQYTDSRPTPVETLRKAFEIGKKEGLNYVYVGNVLGVAEHTLCPHCQEVLIPRQGFFIGKIKLQDASCPSCGGQIAGVF